MDPNPHAVFAHLNAEHAPSYRAILETFARSRAEFVIHLRPSEILRTLRTGAPEHPLSSEDDLCAKLQQLVSWGNLIAVRDSAEVATVEDYYRVRYLYQLSAAGESAEVAIRVFEEHLHRPGELQSAALRDIVDFLDAIRTLGAAAPDLDEAKLHQQFDQLFHRFESLTSRAQIFMRNLQSTIELHEITVDQFLAYKEMLVEYLERFLSDLVLATNEISTKILELGDATHLLDAVTTRALVDTPNPSQDDVTAEHSRWTGRWKGFRRWFLGTATDISQAEILRRRTREAVPELLYTLQTINDRRVSLVNRYADWQRLALWFAEAPDDDSAHRLWRAAFALAPSRHLQINEETLALRDQSPESPRLSWLDAEPLRLAPRLRQSGRLASRSGPGKIVDRTEEKRYLAQLAAEEHAQLERARETLARGRRIRLSELGELDPAAFDLFLELLGEALSALSATAELVEVTSTDGALAVCLEPAPDGRRAAIVTTRGVLRGPDAWITIRYAHQRDSEPSHASASASAAA